MSTRDQSSSLQSDNVEDICEINNVLMIEAELTKTNKAIGKLKDDSVYLLNYVKHMMQDGPNGNFVDNDNKKYEMVDIVDKRKNEQAVSEYKKI